MTSRLFAPLTVVLFTMLVGAANAQQTSEIAGSVAGPRGPLPGVLVTLTSAQERLTVTTDANGHFVFSDLPAGEYEIGLDPGALRVDKRSVTVAPGARLTLTLDATIKFADSAIVTASRELESFMGTSASVSVVTREEIALKADGVNVPQLLQGVPGLNIIQIGARDFNVNARNSTGVLANSMLAMVDGRVVNQTFYGAVFWDLLPIGTSEIEQIEVVRTPASSVWGAGALNGAINVRTKSPQAMTGLRGHLAIGERGTRDAGVTWAEARGDMSYRLSGSYLQQDAWERDNLLPDGSPMPPFAVFANRGTKQPKLDTRIDWGRGVWSLSAGAAGAHGLIHSALGPGEFLDGSYASYVSLDHRRNDWEVKAYWNHLRWPFRILLFGLDQEASNDTYVAEVAKRVEIGARHRLHFGGTIKLDRFDISVAPDDSQRFDAGGFIEDRISLGSHVQLAMGGRLDKFDTTETVFAPRLGVVISPSPTHSFRASYNRAYRAPSLLENFVSVALPAFIAGDPPFFYTQMASGSTQLAMERHDALEVGYTGVLNARTTVFVTAYHQEIDEKIWFLPVTFYGPGQPPPGWPQDPNDFPVRPALFSFINAGTVRDQGVELAARVDWSRVSLHGSYTFRDVPLLTGGPPLEINRPPTHQAGGTVFYSADRWSIAGEAAYTDEAFWSDVLTPEFWGTTEAYVNTNARVSYRLPTVPLDIWLSATNVLDRRIKSHVYGDTIRRRTMAGVRWRWPGA